MKETIKSITPNPILNLSRSIKSNINQRRSFKYDKQRFLRNYSKSKLRFNTEVQLGSRLVFHAHSLEKGLSHKNIRLGFGVSALTNLSKVMNAYVENGFDQSRQDYVNALSVLREYITLHTENGYNTSYLDEIFSKEIIDQALAEESRIGGVVNINLTDKESNRDKNFKDLFNNRWSIREYAKKPVDLSLIEEAIGISIKSPSVCNRQSARVITIADSQLIEETLSLQGGFTGYDTPPVLLVVTSDIETLVGVNERNQPYIDGGLFSMSLLLSLEYVKLAACPLNAMLPISRELKIRKILDIPENESIIMFMSVGHFTEKNPAPKSFRYSLNSISKNL